MLALANGDTYRADRIDKALLVALNKMRIYDGSVENYDDEIAAIESELDRESKSFESKYEAIQIGIKYTDREILYNRINLRVDKMLEAGLLEETKCLMDAGVFEKNATAAQAIGYKELLSYFRGEKTLIEAVEDLKCATRRYAKRQLTWFNSHGNVIWLEADGKTLNELADEAEKIVKEHF